MSPRRTVFIHRLPADDQRRVPFKAECVACTWTYQNTVKTDVEYQAAMHRQSHQAPTAA